MSFSLSQKLEPGQPFFHRFFLAFGVADEVFGLSACRPGLLNPFYYYGLMAMAIPGWTAGTFLGAVSGRAPISKDPKCSWSGTVRNVYSGHHPSCQIRPCDRCSGRHLHGSQPGRFLPSPSVLPVIRTSDHTADTPHCRSCRLPIPYKGGIKP